MAKITLPPISGNVRAGLINSNAQPNMGLAQGLAMAGEVVGQLAEKQEKLKEEKYKARASIAMYEINVSNDVLKDSFDKQAPMTSLDDLDPESKDGLFSRLTKENDKIFNKSIESLNPEDQKTAIARRDIEMRAFKQYASDKHATSLNDARGAAAMDLYANTVLDPDPRSAEKNAAALADIKASYPQDWKKRVNRLLSKAVSKKTNAMYQGAESFAQVEEANSFRADNADLLDDGDDVYHENMKRGAINRLNGDINDYTKHLAKVHEGKEEMDEKYGQDLVNRGLITKKQFLKDKQNVLVETNKLKNKESFDRWNSDDKKSDLKTLDEILEFEKGENPEISIEAFKAGHEWIDSRTDNPFIRAKLKARLLVRLREATGDLENTWILRSDKMGESIAEIRNDTKRTAALELFNQNASKLSDTLERLQLDMDVDTYITLLEDKVSVLYSGKKDPDQGEINTVMSEVNATIASEAIRIAMNGNPDEVVDGDVPEGVAPELWSVMTAEEKELF